MTSFPPIVLGALGTIAVTGLAFAALAITGGATIVGLLYLLLPLAAAACLRPRRRARLLLFVVTLGSMLPMSTGILLAWPALTDALPSVIGMVLLLVALALMTTRTARVWYASACAHRLLER